MTEAKRNILLGLVLFTFGVITLTVLIPTQISQLSEAVLAMGVSPRLFPQVAACSIAALGLLLAGINAVRLRTHRAEAHPPEGAGEGTAPFIKQPLKVGIFFLAVAGYAGLLGLLGHAVASPLGIAAMMYLLGERKPVRIALTAIGTTALLSLFFRTFLNTVLPEGILF